jgi:PAS domain S-box-containing protein
VILHDSRLVAGIWLNGAGRIVDVGRGWLEILSWRTTELAGRSLDELCVPDHASRVHKALAHISGGAQVSVARLRFERPTGDQTLVCRFGPMDEGTVVIAEDVTDRVSGVSQDSTLRSLSDFTSDAWFVHDMDGRIRDANPWACRVLGYERDELVGMAVSSIETTIKPGRLDGVWNRMTVGVPVTVEGRHRRKNGESFPVEARLGLFETADDEILMLAVARDISERKRQEAELAQATAELVELNADLERQVAERTREVRATLQRLEAIVRNLREGLIGVDQAGTIRTDNPVALELLGRAESLIGSAAHEALPDPIPELLHRLRSDAAEGSVDVQLAGGRQGLVEGSRVEASDALGLAALLLIRDVTLEREVDRMKTNFIATVSHELRTPMTSVLGFAKVTRAKLDAAVFRHVPESDAKAQRAVRQVRGNLDIVVTEGTRLTALINNVLDISKMEAGAMQWNWAIVDAAALLEQAAAATSALFDESVELVVHVEADSPTVRADADRIVQVLVNLISNAVKFTDEGCITVLLRPEGEAYEFAVRDTGIGIEESMQARVFERFQQVGDTLTDRPRGTGLGLSICQQILEAHGSGLHLASVPGQGSTFSFALGRADPG